MRVVRKALAVALAVLGLSAPAAGALTFEVDSVADDPSFTACTAGPDDCSLRGAITRANGSDPPVADVIDFEIPGAGPHVITLNGALPVVTQPLTIDGYSETGASANTNAGFDTAFTADGQGSNATLMVEIDGNGHDVLRLGGAGGHVVRGLSIHDSNDDGIRIESDGNFIRGNFIGPLASGAQPTDDGFGERDTNDRAGVYVESGDGNVIGGVQAADRNVISANGAPPNLGAGVWVTAGTGTSIQGNLIGTNPAGTAELENAYAILVQQTASNVTVGGDDPAAGNVISGHYNGGGTVAFNATGTGHRVLRNRIGTNVAGTAAIPNNSFAGVRADGDAIAIGNDAGPNGNLISGTAIDGIDVNGIGTVVEGNVIGLNRSASSALPNQSGIKLGGGGTVVGGDTAAERNVISGNLSYGIYSSFSGGVFNDNVIQGNFIGTDGTGAAAVGNGLFGIGLASAVDATIGGAGAGQGNVISGNAEGGVLLAPAESPENDLNEVIGNKIGTDAAGTGPLPNGGPGVRLHSGFRNVVGRPGQGNLIANNAGDGVVVTGQEILTGEAMDNDRNSIRGNSIFANGALGIDLGPDDPDVLNEGDGLSANDPGDGDGGANDRQNFPSVNAAQPGASTFVRGFLNSRPNATYTIDLYSTPACDASGNGEGAAWIGSTTATTNGFGNALWKTTVAATVPLGQFVTATATDAAGSTSEFSPCRESGTGVADPALAPPARRPTPRPGGSTGQQPTPRGPDCRDRRPPITTLKRGGLTVRDGRVTLTGRSRDRRACPSGVQKVDVSLARVRGRTGVNCRFIRRPNRYSLTDRKNCRRPTLFRARGTRRWSFTFDLRLKPGLYRAQARATDRARNKETPKKRRNIVFFSVR